MASLSSPRLAAAFLLLWLFVLLLCCHNASPLSLFPDAAGEEDFEFLIRKTVVTTTTATTKTRRALAAAQIALSQTYNAPLLPRHSLSIDVIINNPFLVQPRPAATEPVSVTAAAVPKLIPRIIWIAVKDRKDALPGHLTTFFARNPTWAVHVCDNECKDHFMTTSFGNTSLAWAYFAINPLVGAARADIWRYCVLYSFGGLYLDDDSDIGVPLDQVVQPTDHMILSEEGPSSLGECYVPSYHLSDASTFSSQRFGGNATRALFYSPPALVPNEKDLGVSLDGSTGNSSSSSNISGEGRGKMLSAAMITKTGVHVGPVYPLFFHGNTLVSCLFL